MSEHFSQTKLQWFSFMWLMAALLFSAIAMFIGAQPLVMRLFGSSVGTISTLLTVSWIVSGVAAAYLTYCWIQGGKRIFNDHEVIDTVALWFMLLLGYNLGITGVLGKNIFLDMFMGRIVLLVAGAMCMWTAYHLWTTWKANGEVLFAPIAPRRPEHAEGERHNLPVAEAEDSHQRSNIHHH